MFVSTALPFGIALSRAAAAGQWRDDLPAVRDLGLVAVGVGGGLSTLVTQALCLLPLGARTFRAAFGSALALALAARLLYGLVRRLLLEASKGHADRPQNVVSSPRLASTLASIATLTAALSPTWQREGTVGGGAMIATAATLAALSIALRCTGVWGSPGARAANSPASPHLWIALGALGGATFAESPPAGLALAVTFAAILLARRSPGAFAKARLPAPGLLLVTSIACVCTAALLLAPLLLRPVAPRAWVDIGRALSIASLSALDTASARTTALSAWMHEVGAASLCIAAFGAATAALRGRTRVLFAPFLALVALDILLPARAAGVLSADPLTALRSLAVATVTMGSALGVHEVTSFLLRAKIPMGRSAAVLVVVFHLTLIALTSEEAGFAADRSEQLAAEAWADDALGRLEPRAAVLVRSPALAWRLVAARLIRGERPDVVVIPALLLDKGNVASSLLATERELEPLLRSYALTGAPNEFALSKLADVRPLHVEFDPTWPPRLLAHLTTSGLWLKYASEPLGPSDRKMSIERSMVAIRHVTTAIGATALPDAPTGAVVAATLRAHSSALDALGEREAADAFLSRIDEVQARDPLVAEIGLPYARKGMRRLLARRAAPARLR